MVRKESCPICGGKKIIIAPDGEKECKTCKHKWTHRTRGNTAKTDRVRFQ